MYTPEGTNCCIKERKQKQEGSISKKVQGYLKASQECLDQDGIKRIPPCGSIYENQGYSNKRQ